MSVNKEKLEVLKDQAIEVSVNFLHFLSKTQNFNEMPLEEIRSACCSAIKTHSEETKKRLSILNKGNNRSQSQCRKNSGRIQASNA